MLPDTKVESEVGRNARAAEAGAVVVRAARQLAALVEQIAALPLDGARCRSRAPSASSAPPTRTASVGLGNTTTPPSIRCAAPYSGT